MSDDMANAEMGIAVSDALAAQKRLNGENGFEKQAQWSISYLGQRTMAALVLLSLFGLGMILASEDISDALKLAFIAGFISLVVGAGMIIIRKKQALKAFRENQIREYRQNRPLS